MGHTHLAIESRMASQLLMKKPLLRFDSFTRITLVDFHLRMQLWKLESMHYTQVLSALCKTSIISVMTSTRPSSIRKPSLLQVDKSNAGQQSLVATTDSKRHLRRRPRYSSASAISKSITTIRSGKQNTCTA